MRFIQYLAIMLPVSLAYANNDEKIFTSNGQANIVNNNGMVKNITTVQNGNLLSDITMPRTKATRFLLTQRRLVTFGQNNRYYARKSSPRKEWAEGWNGEERSERFKDNELSCSSTFWRSGNDCAPYTTCNSGYYTSSSGSSTADRICSNCVSGQYQNDGSQSSCSTCDPGKYSGSWIATPNAVAGPGLGSFTCNSQWPCNLVTALNPSFMENYANVVIASVVYLQWTGGKIYYYGAKQPTGNAGAGGSTVHSLVGAPSCSSMTISSCPPGRFYSSASATSVVSWTYSGSSANDAICTDCPAGYIKTTTTVPACPLSYPFALEYITTDSGTGNWYCYKTADKNYPCSYGGTLPTPSGQGTWNQNQANCDPGPLLGTYGLCTMCLPGTFESDHTVCKSCPTGFQSTNSTYCSECVNGQYQNEEKQISCKTCLEGTFALDLRSVDDCQNCAAGLYQDQAPAIAYRCQSCGKGENSPSEKEACVNCLIGRYQELTIALTWGTCKTCSKGQATSSAEGPSCSPCSLGHFQGKSESDVYSCKTCAAGRAAVNADSDECVVCGAGQVQPEQATSSYGCIKCQAGKINDDETKNVERHDQSRDCVDCDAGKYNAFPGKDECAICETAEDPGASKCNGCAPGKYLNSTGDCEDCK